MIDLPLDISIEYKYICALSDARINQSIRWEDGANRQIILESKISRDSMIFGYLFHQLVLCWFRVNLVDKWQGGRITSIRFCGVSKSKLLGWVQSCFVCFYDFEAKKNFTTKLDKLEFWECNNQAGREFLKWNNITDFACMKEIPSTSLVLVARYEKTFRTAAFEILDISKGRTKQVYSFRELSGGTLLNMLFYVF